jgi:prepilin-type N-terminal cleavage/methylation domain-containing protein
MSTKQMHRGMSLIEALVALVIVAVGMLALAQVQVQLRLNAEISRQRAEAVRFAQADLEKWRSFSVINADASKQDYAEIVGQLATTIPGQENVNTSYTLRRNVTESASPAYKALTVTVAWDSRNGEPQSVSLDSVIARTDPAFGAQLTVPPAGSPTRNPLNRNVRIPTTAVDLGNKKSGFSPPGQSSVYYVYNNTDASVIQQCTGSLNSSTYNDIIDLGTKSGNTTTYNGNSCTTLYGYTLSGFINFDLSNKLSSIDPADNACKFYQDLQTGTLIASTNPTLNVNSVVLDRQSLQGSAGQQVLPAADKPREYYVNLVSRVGSTPSVNAINVAITGTTITVYMESSSISGNPGSTSYDTTRGPVTLSGGTDSQSFATPTLTLAGKQSIMTLTPGTMLANTVYTLTIPAQAVRMVKGSTTDTNTTASSFSFTTAPNPVLLTSVSPSSGSQIATLTTPIVLTFDTNVVKGTGVFTLLRRQNANNWSAVETYNVATGLGGQGGTITFGTSSPTVTITPGVLQAGETYAIQAQSGTVVSATGSATFGGIANNTTILFTTPAATSTGSCPSTAGSVLDFLQVIAGTPPVGGATTPTTTSTVTSSLSGTTNSICYSDAAASVVAGSRTIGYFCVIYRSDATPFNWSGPVKLYGPTGWLTGASSRYKVCRYHDFDDNLSTADSNLEHPASYASLAESITDQNFLVISKGETCPRQSLNVGSKTGAAVYFNTALLQP